uniref:Uncharacterized protein n=1 Tax=Oryza meridionalis TaxID=40149 RepID=A0A0E0D2W6_9ORYZ
MSVESPGEVTSYSRSRHRRRLSEAKASAATDLVGRRWSGRRRVLAALLVFTRIWLLPRVGALQRELEIPDHVPSASASVFDMAQTEFQLEHESEKNMCTIKQLNGP